jgi:hypothetical protein
MAGENGQRCETCRYWKRGSGKPAGARATTGTCRRFPPVHLPTVLTACIDSYAKEERPDASLVKVQQTWFWGQPATEARDWCGEWRPKDPGPGRTGG